MTIGGSCGSCQWHKFGGPPCYYHNSKFGIGKLTTTIANAALAIVNEAEQTAIEITEELGSAINDELQEWP